MEKFYKVSLKTFLILFLLLIIYTSIAIYIHDPLQVWHKPFFREITYNKSMRESARAFIRDYDFDSVILGDSLSQNTSAKEASELLGGKFFNFSFAGSTAYEKWLVLTYMLKRKKIKRVIYSLDDKFLNQLLFYNKQKYGKFTVLYDNNSFNDFTIYLNDRYLPCCFTFSKDKKCIGKKIENLDKPGAWENKESSKKRFGGFEVWMKYKDELPSQELYKFMLETKLTVNDINEKLDDKWLFNTHKYFDDYLYDVISKNKDVKFYIVLPPVSDLNLARYIHSKDFEDLKRMDELRYLTYKNKKYPNVELYAFNDIEDIGYLEKYRDLQHFEPKINSFILQSIANKEHLLNTDNVEDYINRVYQKALKTDFEYYYNRIKNLN